jgi:hypothetical protein
MSKADELKADISFHEKLLIMATTAAFALVGWIFGHLDGLRWQMGAALLCTILAGGFAFWNYRHIKRLIKELRDA